MVRPQGNAHGKKRSRAVILSIDGKRKAAAVVRRARLPTGRHRARQAKHAPAGHQVGHPPAHPFGERYVVLPQFHAGTGARSQAHGVQFGRASALWGSGGVAQERLC
jgi:hypothetical protein